MKPKMSRRVSNILCCCAVVPLLAAGVSETPLVWYIVSVALAAAAIVMRLTFYRCPACGRFLPRTFFAIDNCPYCGEDLEA